MAYIDTITLLKLVIEEEGSDRCPHTGLQCARDAAATVR
jgi:hypothetical protein